MEAAFGNLGLVHVCFVYARKFSRGVNRNVFSHGHALRIRFNRPGPLSSETVVTPMQPYALPLILPNEGSSRSFIQFVLYWSMYR